MDVNSILIILALVLCLFALVLLLLVLNKLNKRAADEGRALENSAKDAAALEKALYEIKRELTESQRAQRMELGANVQKSVSAMSEQVEKRLGGMGEQIEKRLNAFALENEQKHDLMRSTVERRLSAIQEDNGKRLDEMRAIVDEKLQKTLDERMTKSFSLVNENLEKVYKGLGEMQQLALGVGDLKKVLSNVKTRGILGEIQLGAILEEILAPEQYEKNVAVAGGRNVVEFAVRLPGDGETPVYMPIDSKFPLDAYTALEDAYESGADIHAAREVLKSRLLQFAKDIHDKYISPPLTTDFAVMFLPTEGLYAEAVKMGLIERLQRDYHVSMTGPSTMAALLNSLQMGFKTLAIQKRSSEVFKVLSTVKSEFVRFEDVLKKAQNQLSSANKNLDELMGARTRKILKSLNTVAELPSGEQEDAVEFITTHDDN